MKRCPQCGRDYNDDSMSFCLDDGSELLFGPGSLDEPATAFLPERAASAAGRFDEVATRAQVFTTDETSVLPNLHPHAASKKNSLIAGIIGIIVISTLGIGSYWMYGRGDSSQIRSIAVLPFQNSGDLADSEYISDGLAESMIYRLTQIPDLKVSPRSSVFRYKGKEVDAEKIGAELSVDAVLSGRLVKRGDNITISVDLVDVREKKTLWGEQFERKMSDLLATQREIAATITQKLQLKLTGDAAIGITKNYTNSNEAYQEYLQGRFYWNKRTSDAMTRSIEHFERAVQTDPAFALAHAGIADAQIIAHYLSRKWSDDVLIAKAQANAERAIQLDATLAEPHATLAYIKSLQWEWEASEREYLRAIELNPRYPTTYHWYSRLLRTMGRYQEALVQIKKAQEADPLSMPIAENVVQNLTENGDLDGALAQAKRNIELDPNHWGTYDRMAAVYFAKGQKEEGFAAASKSVELVGRTPFILGFWGYSLAVVGKRDEALAVIKELEAKYAAKEIDGLRIASVYIGLGDKDKAFEWLEKDFQTRRPGLIELRLEYEFKALREDPRFKDLMKRMGLPE